MTNKTIRVKGNLFKPPLLETDEAMVVEFYNAKGELEALVTRVLDDSIWCFSCKADPDWNDTLLRHGYIGASTNELSI